MGAFFNTNQQMFHFFPFSFYHAPNKPSTTIVRIHFYNKMGGLLRLIERLCQFK